MRYAIALLLTCSIACGEMRDVGVLRGLTPREADRDTNGDLSVMDSTLFADAVLWMPFSVDRAPNVYDASTSTNDGTFPAEANEATFTNGVGGAYIFLVDDYIVVSTNSILFDPNEAFTMMAWCSADVFAFDRVFSQGHITIGNASIDISTDNTSKFRMFLRNNAGSSIVITTTAGSSVDTWYHITVTYDGTTNYKIYRNGIEEDSDGGGDIGTISLDRVGVGVFNRSTFTGHWNGGIDDVRIYTSGLASNQVLSAYAAEPTLANGGKR